MLIISEKDIQYQYLMCDALKDLTAGLVSKSKDLVNNPNRTVIEFPEQHASALYMPSADLDNNISSVKIVSIFPENPKHNKPTTQGVLALTDTTNGEHLCLMNASYLTRLRTGALSGIATDKLSKPSSSKLGIIGTGGMGFEQALGILNVRDIKEIYLFNRTPEKATVFKKKLQNFGVTQKITITRNVETLLASSEVICCSTRSNEPVFDGQLLNPGTHINGVGSYLPHMREVDVSTIERASKIVVDDFNGAKEEAGELIYANQNTKWDFNDIYSELFEIAEKPNIRDTNEEITFFKSVGAAYFDLFIAIGIYKKALEKGFGENVTL